MSIFFSHRNLRFACLIAFIVFVSSVTSGLPLSAASPVSVFESEDPILDPAFSPNGRFLVFVKSEKADKQVGLFELGTGKTRVLSSNPGEIRAPCFSGDNNSVFFSMRTSGNFDIFKYSIDTGKMIAITRTPEDEFFCEAGINRFEDDDENSFFRLFYLKGDGTKGALWSVTDSGNDPRQELPGTFTGFSLHSDLFAIVLADTKGLYRAPYLGTSMGGDSVFVDSPGKPLSLGGSVGMKQPIFTGNDLHLTVQRGKETVLFHPGSAATRSLGAVWETRPAFSRARPEMAIVKKQGGKYRLEILPVPFPELKIRNLYKFSNKRFLYLSDSDESWKKIQQNGFVCQPDSYREFFMLYENNRYDWFDSFVTLDSAFHLFHLFYDYILRDIERGTFRSGIASCSQALAIEAAKASSVVVRPDLKALYQRLEGLCTLAALLYDPSPDSLRVLAKKTPEHLRAGLTEDLESILAADGRRESKLLGRMIDFSQFKVRGHYEGDPPLESYFRTVMLFGQMGLKVTSDDGKKPSEELPLILALAWLGKHAKVGNQTVTERLAHLSSPIDFLVGDPEDLPFARLETLLGKEGMPVSPDDCLDPERLKSAFEALKGLPRPKIRPQDGLQVFLFPQRATLDSLIMQRLAYTAVGTVSQPRLLPKLLDVMAALGSDRAKTILLETLKEGRFENYQANLEKVTREVAATPAGTWNENLYRGWLAAFRDLCINTDKPKEAFTQSSAWSDRILFAALGSLTTLRHDTLLYNKMGAAEAGEGGERMYRNLPRVYVDPYPSVYSRMRGLTLELFGLMKSRGFLPTEEKSPESEEQSDEILGASTKGLMLNLARVFEKLESAALKQQNGEALSERENTELFQIGRDLEHLSIALTAKQEDGYGNIYTDQLSLVADVFTGDNTVLECAIGRVFNLLVKHSRTDGFDYLYRGGVYSFFEFEQPISQRLSDKEWKKRISNNQLPGLPDWSRSFIVGDPPKLDPEQEEFLPAEE